MKIDKRIIRRSPYTTVFEYIADHVNWREDRFLYYDYSQWGPWKSGKVKGKIICPIHGAFLQNMNNHKRGQGCPECNKYYQCKSLPEYIELHRDCREDRFLYYDYSRFIWINSMTPGEIICPIHGSFYQSMNNHVHQGAGCPKCAGVYHYKTVYEYIELDKDAYARYIRDNDDFSKAKFKNVDTPIEIICGKCSNIYWQSMSSYRIGSNGCSYCARTFISKKSLVFFDTLKSKIISIIPSLSNYIHYGHGNEIKIKYNNKSLYRIDFAIIKDNIKFAIEYNGSYYHASPRIYKL